MDYITSLTSLPHGDPDAPILIDADNPSRWISWKLYESSIKRISVGLLAIGVQKQDCVALLSPNDIYYYILGDGAIAAGAIFCAIQNGLTPEEMVASLEEAQVKWLFVAPSLIEAARHTLRSLGIEDITLLAFDPPGSPDPAVDASGLCFSSIIDQNEEKFVNQCEDEDTSRFMALRMFTSGSTGRPKAAEFSHAVLVARSHLGRGNLMGDPGCGIKWLHVVGMYHASGQSACHDAFAGLQTTYLSRHADGASIIDRIAQHNITGVLLAPHVMDDVINTVSSGRRKAEMLRSLTIVTTAGAPPRDRSLDALRALIPDALLCSAYGSTESAAVASTLPRRQWKAGDNGTLLRGAEIRILDPETLEEVDPGQDGEICCRGPRLFSGYLGRPDATAASFLPSADGSQHWFRSGDKGRWVGDRLHVTGRYKEIFKCKYEEVAPEEVEEVLRLHPGVEDVVVTSVPARDNEKDNECIAYVVRAPNTSVSPPELIDLAASKLSVHKTPTGGIIFCEGIPRNAMKKVNRSRLVDLKPLSGSQTYLDIPQQNH